MSNTLGINPKRAKFYDKCACSRITVYYDKKFFPKTHTFPARYQDVIAPGLDLTKIPRKTPDQEFTASCPGCRPKVKA